MEAAEVRHPARSPEMNPMLRQFQSSPLQVRTIPFAVFVGLTLLQGLPGESSRYWVYLAKTVVGAVLIAMVWKSVPEMRWKLSWPAVVVGALVFLIWIGLEGCYPGLDRLLSQVGLARNRSGAAPGSDLWNPNASFGEGGVIAWGFITARILGSSIVVPPLEEVFYRSFLYRYVARADFQSLPIGLFQWTPFLVTSVVFGVTHREWLAGILCGFAYQGLVCWKKRLGDAMTAHAITNLLLGGWVAWKGAWQFW
jgi:CAAX prenyl protease-like protein